MVHKNSLCTVECLCNIFGSNLENGGVNMAFAARENYKLPLISTYISHRVLSICYFGGGCAYSFSFFEDAVYMERRIFILKICKLINCINYISLNEECEE